MTAITPVCNTVITTDSTGALYCSSPWSSMIAVQPFDLSMVEPSVFAACMGSGFVIAFAVMSLAWGGRLIVNSFWKKNS